MVDRVSKADGSAAIKNLVKLSQILKFIAKTIMKIRLFCMPNLNWILIVVNSF